MKFHQEQMYLTGQFQRNGWSEMHIIGPNNKKIVDFHDNNLHLMGYSIPVQAEMNLEELQKYLYSLPDQYDAIPYVTSYYNPSWGFCITQRQRERLEDGVYKVFIDTELKDGSLSYGEVYWPGETEDQI